MKRYRRSLVAGIGLLAAALVASYAQAAEQGISGKKLLLKNTNSGGRLVVISKDLSISIADSHPIEGNLSQIGFNNGGGGSGWTIFDLPQTLWSTNSSGTLLKYKNADAPGGPSVVKIAKVKPGLLKVVAKGLPFAVPNGAATIDVVLHLDGDTNLYCMTFSGTGDGNKFLVKDASAAPCPLLPGAQVCCELAGGCSGGSIEGCEFIGGVPVGGGAVCDASGNCVSPPGTPGGCCQFPGSDGGAVCQAPYYPESCSPPPVFTFVPNAICSPSGTCM